MITSVLVLATLLAALSPTSTPPPVWIQRANVAPEIVTWHVADVLGTPVDEGIVVSRDTTTRTMTVSVIDSRFKPPRIVRQKKFPGFLLHLFLTGTRDGLKRNEIGVSFVDHG